MNIKRALLVLGGFFLFALGIGYLTIQLGFLAWLVGLIFVFLLGFFVVGPATRNWVFNDHSR